MSGLLDVEDKLSEECGKTSVRRLARCACLVEGRAA